MSINRFETLESHLGILRDLAATFPSDSPQYIALENAAFALIFAISEQYESFVQYTDSAKEELSNEQKEHLRKLGIPIK